MCKSFSPSDGAWIAIAVAITIALLTSFGAFGQERLNIDRHGDPEGRTVVFIPGLATPGEVFQPYLQTRPDLDAHVLTLAGFGGAPALDPADGVIVPAAEALAEYIQTEGMSDVILVGHSLGSQIALQTAGLAADRIEHVVVVDSLPFFAGLMNPSASQDAVRAQGEAMLPHLIGMDRGAFMAMIQQGAPVQATSPEHQAQVIAYVESSDQSTVAQGTFEALSLDWRPGLQAVASDVTLLVPHNAFLGVSEAMIAERYAAQYEALASLEVRVISDSRHFIMLDQPDAFAEAMADVVGAAS